MRLEDFRKEQIYAFGATLVLVLLWIFVLRPYQNSNREPEPKSENQERSFEGFFDGVNRETVKIKEKISEAKKAGSLESALSEIAEKQIDDVKDDQEIENI